MRVSRIGWVLAAGVAALDGCATIHSGDYGVPLDASNRPLPAKAAGQPTLRISAAEVNDASSWYFGLVEVTFENDSPAWQQIDHIDLDFGTPDRNRSVQIPWGDDLAVWADAIAGRNAVRAENAAMVLGTLAILGAVGRASGRHGRGAGAAVSGVGGLLEIASLGALYASEREQAVGEGSTAPRFSDNHLLATPIRVPPGLFTKRWIVFYTAARPLGGCIDRMVLGYELSDHTRARVLLKYKTWGSEWQRDSCGGYDVGAHPTNM